MVFLLPPLSQSPARCADTCKPRPSLLLPYRDRDVIARMYERGQMAVRIGWLIDLTYPIV
jgi:hypothetical protein